MTTYFGQETVTNYDSTGSPQGRRIGLFTCPGSGLQNVVSLEVYAYSGGGTPGNERLALYDSSGTLVCQWASKLSIDSTSAQWWSQTLNDSAQIVGGDDYYIVDNTDSSDVKVGYNSTGGLYYSSMNYLDTGWPSSLPSFTTSWSGQYCLRCGVEAVGGTTYEVTASMDALIQKTGMVQTASLDALLQATTTAGVDFDALLQAALSTGTNLDGLLQSDFTTSLDIDALIQQALSAGVSIDAMVQAALSTSTALDAIIGGESIATVVLDALLQAAYTRQVSLDALVMAGVSQAVSLDALLSIGMSAGVSLDALAWKAMSAGVGLDAIIGDLGITAIESIVLSARVKDIVLSARVKDIVLPARTRNIDV